MALPGITLPPSFPPWLNTPHNSQPDTLYASVPMRSGHRRARRVFTVAPELREVSLFLTEANAAAFHAWFENDLAAGARAFSAQVQNKGPGLVWYEARFFGEEPYTATPLHAGGGVAWRVDATLRLTGAAYYSGPDTSRLESHVVIGLQGRAAASTEIGLESHVVVGLTGRVGNNSLESHVIIPLIGVVVTSAVVTVNGETVTVNGEDVTVLT